MKKLAIRLIEKYQSISHNSRNHCRHLPSCSVYTKESIEEQGFIVGSYLGLLRILSCNKFVEPKVEVPIKRIKLTTINVDKAV